jgi:hypothetical protein
MRIKQYRCQRHCRMSGFLFLTTGVVLFVALAVVGADSRSHGA